MLAEDFRFEGFDAAAWLNLVSLFRRRGKPGSDGELAAPAPSGTLVVVLNAAGLPCASFITGRGPLALTPFDAANDLPALCAEHGAVGAVVLNEGAIEELTERAAELALAEQDYVGQWLALLQVARQLEDEGLLRNWPPRSRIPLPSAQM